LHGNIVKRGFEPMQVAAGVTVNEPVLDARGNPVLDEHGVPKVEIRGKYGLHALRHAAAALWIEQKMSPKKVQRLMGHATIALTLDTYGYLFDSAETDQEAAEQIQMRLLGS